MKMLLILIVGFLFISCGVKSGKSSSSSRVAPRVSISADLAEITVSNITTFMVSGTCSEEGQPITVSVEDLTPETAPICTNRYWSTEINLSRLTGPSREISITADHFIDNLAAIQATESVFLHPRVDIAATVGNITGDTFTVNGMCSEEGQPVTVVVGEMTPAMAPLCMTGTWDVTINVSGLLTGASRPITIIVDHATSGSNPLAVPQVVKVVALIPRVGIAAPGDITDATFVVNGTCSEEDQPVIVAVGGLNPATAPLCATGTWSTSIDVSGLLTGASRLVDITANHETSNGLAALQATESTRLYPRVSIATTVGNITESPFVVNGTCSEEGEPVTVDVGGLSPTTAPLCTTGIWSTSIDVSGLGASMSIDITADHSTSGSSPLEAIQAVKTVTLYPQVGIASTVGNITGDTFVVNGTCSEEGQPVTVDVGGLSPATAPLCTTGAWSTSLDVSGLLTGASRPITITADHTTSGSNPLEATQAMKVVALIPRVSIATTVGNITGDTFVVNGTCSEEGQPVTVDVGGLSPTTAPLCATGTWSTSIDVSGLGASGFIDITADHTTSGSSPLEATQAVKTVTLYPRVGIASTVGNITESLFAVNGTCSEEGQPVTVDVGGLSPATAPLCTTGTWSASLDVSSLLTGASRPITITADHTTSGSNPLEATQAVKIVALTPRVSIADTVGDITGTTFAVSGTCSEEGQSVTVAIGEGEGEVSPETAPLCTDGSWEVTIDVSGLGASMSIDIMADHSTSGSPPLAAPQAVKTVTLYPRVTLDIDPLADITSFNAGAFPMSGTCSEEGQSVAVRVGTIDALPAPLCTSTGTWSVDIDVSSLSGTSVVTAITVDHSSAGDPSLDAIQVTANVLLNPTISINTRVLEDITSANASRFMVRGHCAEEGETVEVRVGVISPETHPNCTHGAWAATIDVTILNKTPGTVSVTADHSPSGGLPYPQVVANVTNYFTCPLNYVAVPSLASYTPYSFCVMKYEAKNDGSGNAISQASGEPYVSISRDNSITKCMALGEGYDLITNDEWQTLARNIELVPSNWDENTIGSSGGLSRGHSDNSPDHKLAASDDDNMSCYETEQTCSKGVWSSQKRIHVLSNKEVIWDVAGNIWEQVKDDNGSVYDSSAYFSEVTATSHPTLNSLSNGTTETARNAKGQFGPSGDYTNLSVSPYGGLGRGFINSGRGVILRSGYWNSGDEAGVFTTYLFNSPASMSTGSGFRCAYHP